MIETLVRTGEAVQGLLAIQRLLTEAELAEVQVIVEQCVAQAHADVNESYQRQGTDFGFKNGKFPNDAECERVVRRNATGRDVTLAQELGVLKHAAAFACIEKRLPQRLRDHFSVEPRYKGETEPDGAVLTNNKSGSLQPDIVLHATRNATHLQCVFELKFPCFEKHRLEPMGSPRVTGQLEAYQALSKNCRVALVTPTGIKFYEGR